MCLRNLFRRRTRTSLCVFGVALGVALITAVGATTTRYVSLIKEMNVFYRGDVVVVPRGSIFVQAFSFGGFLHESALDEVKRVEGIRNAVPMLFVLGSPTHEGVIQLVPSNVTVGIPAGDWSVLVGSTPLKPGGSWPSANTSEREVVIGASLSDVYGLNVGSEIEVNKYKLRIVGVLRYTSAFLARTIIMPLKTAQEIYGFETMVSMMVVEPQEGIEREDLANRIETQVLGVRALTDEERNEIVEPMFRDIELWSLGITSAVFLMSAVLVMMVAVMNVSERRRELATLDAIGAPKSSIVRIVATETGLIGLLGGLLGIPIGAFATLLLVCFYTKVPLSLILGETFILVPPAMMLKTMMVTVALSCIAGLIPAIAFGRKNIAELLRLEH